MTVVHPSSPDPERPWQERLAAALGHLWAAITSLFRSAADGEEPEPDATPQIVAVRVEEDPHIFTFTTPAKGDAYDFELEVRCDWCSRDLADAADEDAVRGRLRDTIREHRADMEERVTSAIRREARRFPPYEPAALEQALIDRGVCTAFNTGEFQCHVRARVSACDAIREKLRPGWLAMLQQEADLMVQRRHVEKLRELRPLWETLLREAMQDAGVVDIDKTGWLAPYPLALCETPAKASDYLVEVLNQRQAHSKDLLKRLGEVAETSQRLDVWDVIFETDNALRAVMKDLGVPVRDLPDESPFAAS